jgi:general secretion pathway protein J
MNAVMKGRARGCSGPRLCLREYSQRGGNAAKTRGFTLIEVVLATLLLAFGMLIAFGSVRSAQGSVARAEAAARRNEHLRAVQGFLRRQFEAAQPLVMNRDPRTQEVTFLDGDRKQLRFVAPMPGYLSRGGPYVQTFRLDHDRLEFTYAMLVDEKSLADDLKLPAEPLLDGIADAHFQYRSLGPDGRIADWTDGWHRAGEMPLEVRLLLRFRDPGLVWPNFETALPLAFARAQATDVGIESPPSSSPNDSGRVR